MQMDVSFGLCLLLLADFIIILMSLCFARTITSIRLSGMDATLRFCLFVSEVPLNCTCIVKGHCILLQPLFYDPICKIYIFLVSLAQQNWRKTNAILLSRLTAYPNNYASIRYSISINRLIRKKMNNSVIYLQFQSDKNKLIFLFNAFVCNQIATQGEWDMLNWYEFSLFKENTSDSDMVYRYYDYWSHLLLRSNFISDGFISVFLIRGLLNPSTWNLNPIPPAR